MPASDSSNGNENNTKPNGKLSISGKYRLDLTQPSDKQTKRNSLTTTTNGRESLRNQRRSLSALPEDSCVQKFPSEKDPVGIPWVPCAPASPRRRDNLTPMTESTPRKRSRSSLGYAIDAFMNFGRNMVTTGTQCDSPQKTFPAKDDFPVASNWKRFVDFCVGCLSVGCLGVGVLLVYFWPEVKTICVNAWNLSDDEMSRD